jgi:hypothetical protein
MTPWWSDELLQLRAQPRCLEEEEHLATDGEVVQRIRIQEFFSNLPLFLSNVANYPLKSVLKIEGVVLQMIQRVEVDHDRAGACKARRTGRRRDRVGASGCPG